MGEELMYNIKNNNQLKFSSENIYKKQNLSVDDKFN